MSPQVLSAAFLLLCSLLLYVLALIFAPFMTPILWAMILVRLFYPLYQCLTRKLGDRTTVSAALSTLSVMLLAVLPVAYLVFLVVTETLNAYQLSINWVQEGGLQRLPDLVARLPLIGNVSQELLGRLVLAYADLQPNLVEGGKAVSGVLLSGVGGLATNAMDLVMDFFVILFTLFFLFRDGHKLYRAFYEALPIEESYKAVIMDRLDNVMGAVVEGTLLTALAQGFTAGLAYWALGVPFSVFLGALSALLSLVPIGGTALVWGPVAAYLVWIGPIWKGIVMIGIGIGLVGLMDNLLKPFLVGSKADLPVLFLFFASLGGLASFGFIGLFLGPILLGIALAVFQIYRENYQAQAGLLVKAESGHPKEPGNPIMK